MKKPVKITAGVVGFLLLAGIIGSSTGGNDDNNSDSASEATTTTVKIDTNKDTTENTKAAVEVLTEKEEITENITTQAETEEIQQAAEEVLYESDGIKIVYKGYTAEELFQSAKFDIYIENNSDKNISVSLDELNVNGYTISCLFYEEVPAGKKANAQIDLYSTQLEENNIESIGVVEFALHATDSSTYDRLFETETITITLDETVSQEQSTDNYEVIYQGENVTVYYTGLTEETGLIPSHSFGFLVVNDNTDKNITVSADNMSINDFAVTDLFYAEVSAGKKTNDSITIYKNELEENGIETIEKFEFTLSCIDDSYNTLWETEPITIAVN